MRRILRQGLSFILPITVLILVPGYIEKNWLPKSLPTFLAGILIMCAGLVLMVKTISSIIRIGDGTLAPWSPTKKLVKTGLYAYVRNPMILGVLTVLIGESIAVSSENIFIWACIFFIVNNIFFFVYEEPNLQKKFGDEYWEYKKNVPRWAPRLKGWGRE